MFVWLDLRRPMLFATRGAYKGVRAAEIAALIAWSAVANGDRLGGLVFSETEHHELRPSLGLARGAAAVPADRGRFVLGSRRARERAGRPTPIARCSGSRASRGPGSLIFLISDFRRLGADAERHLRELAGHCDLVLVHVFDPVEAELPPPGRYRVASGGRTLSIETSNDALRRKYRERFAARVDALRSLARRPGIHLLECATHADARVLLAQKFRQR